MQDAASLDNLRDIAEPVPVSWWPLAPGWWLVITLAILGLAAFGFRAWQRWKANAYRRAALAELQNASTDVDISAILKRTALCACPRINVASLVGDDWVRWLAETGGRQIPLGVSERLKAGVFREDSTSTRELSDFATRWIKFHKIEKQGSSEQTRSFSPSFPVAGQE